MAQLGPRLDSLVRDLWTSVARDGFSDPLTALEQISYLLVLKQFEVVEREDRQDALRTGGHFESPFDGQVGMPPVDKETLRWSEFTTMPDRRMLEHLRHVVVPSLGFLGGPSFVNVMQDATFLVSDAQALRIVTKLVEAIFEEVIRTSGARSGQAIMGEVYDLLLDIAGESGRNGQLRTPSHIVQLMNDLVEPKVGQTLCDPACGLGSFLIGAVYHISEKASETEAVTSDRPSPDKDASDLLRDASRSLRATLASSLHGFDINPTVARLAAMNLVLHGLHNPRVLCQDALAGGFADHALFDIILSTPPFSGTIEQGDRDPDLHPTNKTELLFIERAMRLLRPGGMAAMVVPRSVLFGSTAAHTWVRRMLVNDGDLKAVITLPPGVFLPYAGTPAAILIFAKDGPTEQVWFYDVENVGFSLDKRRLPIEGGQLQNLVARWRTRRDDPGDRATRCFTIAADELREAGYNCPSSATTSTSKTSRRPKIPGPSSPSSAPWRRRSKTVFQNWQTC